MQTGQPGRIGVQTAKANYYGGEMISGNVFVQAYTPIACRSVSLTLTGYERAKWHETASVRVPGPPPGWRPTERPDGTMSPPPTHHNVKIIRENIGENICFKKVIPVCTYSTALPPGTYTYPFQFKLPDTLPGVFAEVGPISSSYDDSQATMGEAAVWAPDISARPEIRQALAQSLAIERTKTDIPGMTIPSRLMYSAHCAYTLDAFFDVAGVWEWADLRGRQSLVVNERIDASRPPPQDSKTEDVVVCCCCKKGTLTMRSFFEKAWFSNGETIQIMLGTQNDSEVNIDRTVVRLFRELTLMSGNGKRRTFRKMICDSSHPGVAPMSSNTKPVPLQLSSRGGHIQPSTNGQLVKNEYYVQVTCDTAGPFSPDIHLRVPVQIFERPPETWGTACWF
eukprot:gnl/Carplike_NY0171/161_a234_5640.p1 GENE.gnl/Carplike_NY0171/161_a234_5640~~gnl/Carplike_NY0171/161_a234_5640.p1  ORF type:complete len:409 (-),score=132.60 gnl/Carplike_NY0171/161_a234_5640:111-1295(-)